MNLEFESGSLHAIAHAAIERNTGARGLRSIIEEVMMDIMFDLPSRDDVEKAIITEDTVKGTGKPTLILMDGQKAS